MVRRDRHSYSPLKVYSVHVGFSFELEASELKLYDLGLPYVGPAWFHKFLPLLL